AGARAVSAARATLPDGLAQRARIEVHRPATAGKPARVRVSVDVPLVTPILSGLTIPLTWTSSMLVEP
ncbi:MAG: hypothetical protein ACLGHX_00650, partial [Acidimicrobiia bacterium]